MKKIIYFETALIAMGLISSVIYGVVRGITEGSPLLTLVIALPAILAIAYVVWDWKTTSTSTDTKTSTASALVSK